MEQKELLKNITGTVCVVGLAFSAMSFNGTQIVDAISDYPVANYGSFDEQSHNSTINIPLLDSNNIYLQGKMTKLEKEARELFGYMREATKEESASVNNYIKTISKETGVKFFDLC